MTSFVAKPDLDLLAIAPDAVIRFISSTMWVHTGSGACAHAIDDTATMQVFLGFSTPKTTAQALSHLPLLQQHPVRMGIARLRQIGALVTTNVTSPAQHPPTEQQLGLLADGIQRVAGDLAAMGPYVDARQHTQSGSISVAQRLTALVAGLTALQAELHAMRPGFIAAQMKQLLANGTLKPPPHTGLKLHLGCGGVHVPGWINIDAYPAELALDLRWGLPFEAESVDYVFMSHTFEHLYHPEESSAVLDSIHKALAPGGRLRLIVPDIELCIQAYQNHDRAFASDRQHTWPWWPDATTRLEDFLSYAGAGPRASHFLEGHKFGYDFETLAQALSNAGFCDIQRSTYMGSTDPILQIDHVSAVAGAQTNGTYYSLFVEASKPVADKKPCASSSRLTQPTQQLGA